MSDSAAHAQSPDEGSPSPRMRGAAPGPNQADAGRQDRKPVLESTFPAAALAGDGQSTAGKVDSAEVAGSAADARSMEWCAILYKRLGRQAEFHVVAIEKGGSRRRVASSPAFRAPTFGAVRRRGKARAAHELLVTRLEASGWRPVEADGAWHELGFVRSNGARMPPVRPVVRANEPEARSPRAVDDASAFPQSSSIPEKPEIDLRRKGQPDVRALLEKEDVEGLERAADFQAMEHGFEARSVDGGTRIREQAILALGELGPEVGSKAVAAGLHDSSDCVRSAAVQVLHSRGEGRLLAKGLSSLPPTGGESRQLALQAILEHRSSSVVRAAARAVVRAPGDAPLSEGDVAFVRSLVGSEGSSRGPAKVVLGELLKALADDRWEVVERAEELLVELAPTSTPYVIAELDRERSPDRAASVLGRIGDSSALQPLLQALEHHHEGVRVQAAAALGLLRDPAAVESLLRATRDSDLDVRTEASNALDEMGAAGVIVGVSALLRSTVMEAVASVAELPPPDRARRVVPQLSAPAESSWQFGEALEAERPPGNSDG